MNEDLNNSFFDLSDDNILDDSSVTIDSFFLKKTLLNTSVPYPGEISKSPKEYSFPKYLHSSLVNNNTIICNSEVHERIFGKIAQRVNEINHEDKENLKNCNTLNNKQSEFTNTLTAFKTSNNDARYKIDINNMDGRTTCMIKNIPNKYTQKMLINLLNENHFGCFNFVYLRMDFKNKCNVGYAFINFTSTEHIVSFYKKINNKGWKLFSSSKIAELTYASIQGFNNLINKFRYSLVMKEQESFRPKIFFTDGPQKGHESPMF